MKKIQNKMHTLGERIQEYGVRISSFYLFQLNTSTSQQLNILVFPYSSGATTWHEGLSWKYSELLESLKFMRSEELSRKVKLLLEKWSKCKPNETC